MKTLGFGWNCDADNLIYHLQPLPVPERVTKRSVLSSVSRLFDPLGLLSPVIIKAKVFMQALWLSKVDWDSKLSRDLELVWLQYSQELPNINHILIPRNVIPLVPVKLEIHTFGNASLKALGAAVYLRTEDSSGNVAINFLASKSKVAPMKTVTLPRLELNAAVMAIRLANCVSKALNLNVDERHF